MSKIRFKNKNEFSLYIQKLKIDNDFDTYIETVSYFYENEGDSEMEDIKKMLNTIILNKIKEEAIELNLTKEKAQTGKLF